MEGWSRFLDTFFNWMVIERYLPGIMKGVVVTIEIATAVVVAGILFGLALAIVRAFRVLAVNALIVVFVDVFRALPPLVLILLVYFALPNIGIITLEDAETGEQIEINTSDRTTRLRFTQEADEQEAELAHTLRRNNIDRIALRTGEDYLPALRSFFKQRERRMAIR